MKNILITGASRGIGRAIAEALAEKDSHLLLHGRDKAALSETEQLVLNKNATAELLTADLSDRAQTIALAQSISCEKLDVIVHNAGIAGFIPFEQMTEDEWDRMFAVNVTAPFLLTKYLNDKLTEGSSIVNILSGAAKSVYPNNSGYCMTKFALNGLMRTIREEMRSRKVRVINVYPGSVATEIWDNLPGDWDRNKMMKAEDVARSVKHTLEQPQGTLVEDLTLMNLGGAL